jgi:transcriptional regulator with XRE-family HTH domain
MSARRNRTGLRGIAATTIKEARCRENVSQMRLAQLLGISQPLVSSWECGKVTPGIDDVARIETVLGVNRGGLLLPIAYPVAGNE